MDMPLTTYTLRGSLGSWGSVGVEYLGWNWEVMVLTSDNPYEGRIETRYERSVALGYALPVSDRIAVGAQVRYAWNDLFHIEHFLFSVGASYTPEIFSERLALGLSLMNFGTKIKLPRLVREVDGHIYDSAIPLPSQLNIGGQGLAVSNSFFILSASASATKPFIKTSGPYNSDAQSSFKSFFNDWDDFPNDVTGHIGLGFLWHPIYLGAGVSFFQEMYLGFVSRGPKDGYTSYYTHGIKVGLEAYGLQASAGYAGHWQSNVYGAFRYISWEFPWESFQFTLSADMSTFGKQRETTILDRIFDQTIIAGGYSYCIPIGRMRETRVGPDKVTFSKNHLWSLEADFYMTENSAILASFSYSRMTESIFVTALMWREAWTRDFGIETVSFESGFRYHPIEVFHPFFVQASLGIIRMNPVEAYSSPRYTYKSFDEVAVGCIAPVMEGIVVTPKIALKTLFMEAIPYGRIVGYNQVELGLKIGYRL
jgi:hypothetical protein